MSAVDAWRAVVGSRHVTTDEAALRDAGTATFPTAARVLAVVRPGSVEEVAACVRVANAHRVPLHVVSRGLGWGLGSRAGVRDDSALLDLARLDRIVAFDERLGTLTVQPGVTFRQAHAFLRERGSRLFAAVTGGPPDGSLLGNALDRGEGAGPCGDRAAHVCGLEVVLPTGETIRTGFGRFGDATTTRLSRWGLGPSLDGLFVQSGFGIVTELTVWLHPRPKLLERFEIAVDDTPALAPLVDAVQPLVLDGTIPAHAFGIWNALLTAAERARYPWGATQGRTPLRLREISGREPWTASGALYAASEAQRDAGCALVAEALRGLPHAPAFRTVPGQADAEDLCLGNPTIAHLPSMYWRKRETPSAADDLDPHRDRCGLLWIHVALPFTGAHAVGAAALVEETTAAHALEPLVGLSAATGRLLSLWALLAWDRDVAGEDERALACHDRLLAALTGAGYPPYRLALPAMPFPEAAGSASYDALLRRLKAELDPNRVLAPGRYEPGTTR